MLIHNVQYSIVLEFRLILLILREMKVFPPILPQFVGTPPNPSKNANSCPLAGFRLLFAIRTSSNGNSPLRRQSPFSGLWELHFLCGFSPFVLLGIRPLHNLADNAGTLQFSKLESSNRRRQKMNYFAKDCPNLSFRFIPVKTALAWLALLIDANPVPADWK